MIKYCLSDDQSFPVVLVNSFFLAFASLFLFILVTSMRPAQNHLVAWLSFCCIAFALVSAIIWLVCHEIKVRWTDIDKNGLIIHEVYLYGIIWNRREVPASKIISVARFDIEEQGFTRRHIVSQIRVSLEDGTSIILTKSLDPRRIDLQLAEAQRALDKV